MTQPPPDPPPPPIFERAVPLSRPTPFCSWWTSLIPLALAAALLMPPVRIVWHSLYGVRWAYILCLSALLSVGLTPLVGRLAVSLRILDVPSGRKAHAAPTPLLGGLAVYISFLIALLANSIMDWQMAAILIGGSVLMLVGVLDDARGLPAAVRLLAQLLAVTLVIGSGVSITLFSRSVIGNLADAALTIIWLLGITNAMNFFDGMDGLATGLAIITASLLGLFAFLSFQPFLGWFAAALVGSCLGFLPYNFRRSGPALIFLGDAGSTFLGFVLAALAIKGDWAAQNIIDIAAPVLIFWVFIYDMTYITAARILSGKVRSFHDWIAYVGRDHLHHRLAGLLGSRPKAVLMIYLISICMGMAAIALVGARPTQAVVLICQGLLFAAIFSVLEHAGNREE
jgi:UDP-GlcNAc:undecaprenyl-phosphate/decaprenyl-phosphate GlcNAc-1-phosphate transferase